jgi:5-(carboxyamino)imidazole ribonucleotide mutase
MKNKVIIIMGSKRDLEFCRKVAKSLKALSLPFEFRVASAHKTPEKALKILNEFQNERIVYITVAGRSNALSAFIDANTEKPVIACPPYSEKFSGADIYSSLRLPSGIASLVNIEPEGAAIGAAKIFALGDHELRNHIIKYQHAKKKEIEKADESFREMK